MEENKKTLVLRRQFMGNLKKEIDQKTVKKRKLEGKENVISEEYDCFSSIKNQKISKKNVLHDKNMSEKECTVANEPSTSNSGNNKNKDSVICYASNFLSRSISKEALSSDDNSVIEMTPEVNTFNNTEPEVLDLHNNTVNVSNESENSIRLSKQQPTSLRGNVIVPESSGSESFYEDSDDSVADPDFEYRVYQSNRSSSEEDDNNDNTNNDAPQYVADQGLERNPIIHQDVSGDEQSHHSNNCPDPNVTIIEAAILQPSSSSRLNKLLKQKQKHPILPVSCKKCHRQCADFSSEERMNMWETYWSMAYVDRRKWLLKCVQIKPVKRHKTDKTDPTKRNFTRMFTMQKHGVDVPVCRNFFLSTLGYTSDTIISELVKVLNQNSLALAVRENRGGNRKAPLDIGTIEAHIESYHPAVSHYRRHNAPLTRYLPRHLTLKDMFEDFNLKHPNVCKREIYRKTLKKMRISLKMPKSDECADCIHFKDLSVLYKLLNSDDTLVVSVDLQKVMLIPMMPSIKEAFFTSRLVVFNLTFAPLNSAKDGQHKSSCILWHEAMSGRDASDIVNAFLAFMKEKRDVKHFIFWADNCTAQNKNYILYTAFTTLVNQNNGPESITIKYLTKGHTHMTADGVHGNIETQIRKVRTIYDFDDMVITVKNSRQNLDVLVVSEKYKWEKKKRALKKGTDPLKDFFLNSLVSVQFQKGSRLLLYKTEFAQDDYESIDFLMKKYNVTRMPQSITADRGINKEKKQTIVKKLVPLMATNRQTFWRNLTEAENAVDLVTDGVFESE